MKGQNRIDCKINQLKIQNRKIKIYIHEIKQQIKQYG